MDFLFHIKAFGILLIPTFILSYFIQPPKTDMYAYERIFNFILRSLAYTVILYFIIYTILTQINSDVLKRLNISYGGLNLAIN